MIANLFSIFDPATQSFMSLNWASVLLFLLMVSYPLYITPNRPFLFIVNLVGTVHGEFKPLLPKAPYLLLTIISFFVLIRCNNFMGLAPYIFTSASHLTFTLSLGLSSWLALMLFGWVNNMSNLLAHLIPQGTPPVLMPFMVLIETTSNLIRPGTLAVRLAANIIAGHLLITLLRSATPITPLVAAPFLITAQLALSLLEIAVALIQAYVFRVLVVLYAAEVAN